jgi:hypothetical protein
MGIVPVVSGFLPYPTEELALPAPRKEAPGVFPVRDCLSPECSSYPVHSSLHSRMPNRGWKCPWTLPMREESGPKEDSPIKLLNGQFLSGKMKISVKLL